MTFNVFKQKNSIINSHGSQTAQGSLWSPVKTCYKSRQNKNPRTGSLGLSVIQILSFEEQDLPDIFLTNALPIPLAFAFSYI